MGVNEQAAKAALIAGLVAGVTYLFVMHSNIGPTAMLAWKGAGVWFLAIYAALGAKKLDAWLITAVMALGALGDVLVETNIETGAVAFIFGHILASILYLKNRRLQLSPSQKWLSIILTPALALISWNFTADLLSVFYSLFLAIMASSAWISRFPRYRTGIGAMMFVVSDMLIFAREASLMSGTFVDLAIWALYFAGQLLIVLGVKETLAKDETSALAR